MTRRILIRWLVACSLLLLVLALVALAQRSGAIQKSEVVEAAAPEQGKNPVPTLHPDADREKMEEGAHAVSSAPETVLTQSRSISPGGFIRDEDSTDILPDIDFALRWDSGSNDEAGFYMRRPVDWDGISPIKVTLYFALGGNGAGTVNWRLKLNTYTPNSGEWLTNPGTRDADAILNFASGPSWYRIYSQSFTLQPADFHGEPLWSIFFQRGNGANGETFTGYLYLLDAEVEYEAVSPLDTLFMPKIER